MTLEHLHSRGHLAQTLSLPLHLCKNRHLQFAGCWLIQHFNAILNLANCVCVCVVVPGGAAGSGSLPGVQAGFAERVQTAGRTAPRTGQSAYQDRRQQDAQNLRFPHQRGTHHEGLRELLLTNSLLGSLPLVQCVFCWRVRSMLLLWIFLVVANLCVKVVNLCISLCHLNSSSLKCGCTVFISNVIKGFLEKNKIGADADLQNIPQSDDSWPSFEGWINFLHFRGTLCATKKDYNLKNV